VKNNCFSILGQNWAIEEYSEKAKPKSKTQKSKNDRKNSDWILNQNPKKGGMVLGEHFKKFCF
jgi:hypothetical protein